MTKDKKSRIKQATGETQNYRRLMRAIDRDIRAMRVARSPWYLRWVAYIWPVWGPVTRDELIKVGLLSESPNRKTVNGSVKPK